MIHWRKMSQTSESIQSRLLYKWISKGELSSSGLSSEHTAFDALEKIIRKIEEAQKVEHQATHEKYTKSSASSPKRIRNETACIRNTN